MNETRRNVLDMTALRGGSETADLAISIWRVLSFFGLRWFDTAFFLWAAVV
jgi:hypothetical protein